MGMEAKRLALSQIRQDKKLPTVLGVEIKEEYHTFFSSVYQTVCAAYFAQRFYPNKTLWHFEQQLEKRKATPTASLLGYKNVGLSCSQRTAFTPPMPKLQKG
jgi:hypothetical protein